MKQLLLLVLVCAGILSCNNIRPPFVDKNGIPLKKSRLVNDYSGRSFSSTSSVTLEQKLQQYKKDSGIQIAVIAVASLPSNPDGVTWGIKAFAAAALQKWFPGESRTVLIVQNTEQNQVAIAASDDVCSLFTTDVQRSIFEKEFTLQQKETLYDQALARSIKAIGSTINGTYVVPQPEQEKSTPWYLTLGMVVLVVFSAWNIKRQEDRENKNDHQGSSSYRRYDMTHRLST